MAVIKCKMCGGELNITEGMTVAECEYCGSKQTLPKLDDQQRTAAFDRGNHFRRLGEFDKALSVYERIVQEDESDAEAHWCCALCRFGIEYVKDPASGDYLPTCHRASFDSFLEDVDYKAALAHADDVSRRQYEQDGEQIAVVQRGILATVQKEKPFDVFICYKETDEQGQRTVDSTLAQDIYYQLIEQGRRVFFSRITLEDKAGQEYEPYIFAALRSAKVMVVVGTRPEYLNAVWVKNEWSRYLALMKHDRKRLLIPCYRDMDPYDLPEQLSILQSYDMGKIGFIQDLIRGVNKVLDADKKPEVQETVVVQSEGGGNLTALLKRGNMALEDGEWNRADEFFEQALNIDAECAQAYFGKMLAARRYANAQMFVVAEKNGGDVSEGKQLEACPEDEAYIAKAIKEFEVPTFLTGDTIRCALRDFNRTYKSMGDARQKELEHKRQELQSDTLFSKAVRYAKGDFREQINQMQKEILDIYQSRVDKGHEQDAQQAKQITEQYAEFLQDTRESLKNRHTAAIKNRKQAKKNKKLGIIVGAVAAVVIAAGLVVTQIIIPKNKYKAAEALLIVGDYDGAVAAFEALGSYSDAVERISEARYSEAESLLTAGNYDGAIAAFEALGDYSDATDRISEANYSKAENLLAAGNYDDAITAFESLGNYSNAAERIQEIKYTKAENLLAAGDYGNAAIMFGSLGDFSDAREQSFAIWDKIAVRNTVAAGTFHTVALKADGTAMAVGSDTHDRCNVSGWNDLIAIDGYSDSIGLKSDHTVLFAGSAMYGAGFVFAWENIVAISSGMRHTIGLMADGKVVAQGDNTDGQCDVSNWSDIVAISGGDGHTVGLKTDGTVVTVGWNNWGQCNTSSWSNIVAIDAGDVHTVGLKPNGTVVAVGRTDHGRCDVENWTNIVAITAGHDHTVGLKSDGTVVATGNNEDGQCNVSNWRDIVAVSAGNSYTVGLKSDGTLISVGDNGSGQRNISGWNGIKVPENT